MTLIAISPSGLSVLTAVAAAMNAWGAMEFYFTFSYSPVTGADGTIEGVLDVVTDVTAPIVGRRRLELLARLTDRVAVLSERAEVRDRTLDVLRTGGDDFTDIQITGPLRERGDHCQRD